MVRIIFESADGGSERVFEAEPDDTLLDVAQANGIDIEGACEGNMACSTCHLIIDPEWHAKLAEPSEEEEDMLDLAYDLTRTSRLGCQIVVSEALDGLRVRLPREIRNALL